MNEPQNDPSSRCPQCGAELPDGLPREFCPKCLLKKALPTEPQPGPAGTVVISPESLLPGLPRAGEQLGHYRIIRSLGSGGMGTVFEAEDLENGRRVALKVLSQALDSPDARRRFFREGRLAASINHPNSVYVFGTEELGGVPLITMELVAGGTLEERVKAKGPMPPAEAVDAVLQIIAGLEEAQRTGILHRDVKPSNCFVDTSGTVKIGDFGLSISTAIRTETALTAAGTFLGTPAFCSPEQLRGEELNARSDMYSVGATLFYLLTGQPPFQAKNAIALIATVMEQPAPSPRQFRPKLPSGLAKVVRRCLEKQPGERFKSYEELRNALASWSSAAPVPAPLGLRFVAGVLDIMFTGLLGTLIPMVATSLRTHTTFALFNFVDLLSDKSRPAQAIAYGVLVGFVLYYALLEGIWGVTLGRLICGLRVTGRDNNPPGFLRALPRPLICVMLPYLPQISYFGVNPTVAEAGSKIMNAFVGFSQPLTLAIVFCTARRRNGFAAIHDLVTQTRVVLKTAIQARPAPAVGEASPPSVEAKPLIGPYHVLETLEDSADLGWLLGYDLRLLRKVWIRTVPAGTPPVPAPLRNLGRIGRLRWLAGRRSPEENWDAFEALSGQPLPELIRGKSEGAGESANPQLWSQVRHWLNDLATELSAAQKEGTLPARLALDRIWITGEGRAKILDFPFREPTSRRADGPPLPNPLPPRRAERDKASTLGRFMGREQVQKDQETFREKASERPTSPRPSPPSEGGEGEDERALGESVPGFLGRVAAVALEGRVDAAAKPTGEISIPLAVPVRQFFLGLPQILDADAFLLALRPLLSRGSVVTRRRRVALAAACMAFPVVVAGFAFFMATFLGQWSRHNPDLTALMQVLQFRSAMQRVDRSQTPAPTDRQFAIYIASHYRAVISDSTSWSSTMGLALISDADRHFAQDSLTQYPAPTTNEVAEANVALMLSKCNWELPSEGTNDLSALMGRLSRHADTVSLFVWQSLSNQDQTLLTNYRPPSSKPRLVNTAQPAQAAIQVLNKLIGGPSIYDFDRFKGVPLRPETTYLVSQIANTNLAAFNRVFLNRLLLEDAFPREISRIQYLPSPDLEPAMASLGLPSLVWVMNFMLFSCVCLPALIVAFVFRGGLVLLLGGVTFVRRDGAPASRLRLLARAVVTWGLFLAGAGLVWYSYKGWSDHWGEAVIGLYYALAVLSLALPERGLPDRLTGTWPVLR